MLFHRCSFVLLTWFRNISYFLLKGDASASIKFCQLLVPENNGNVLYWSQHFWLESYLLCILISNVQYLYFFSRVLLPFCLHITLIPLGSEKSGMRGWWCFFCFVQRMCKLKHPVPMSPIYIHYFSKQCSQCNWVHKCINILMSNSIL